jgi:hypothetical protein
MLSSIVLERDLEALDAALADTLWTAVVDPTVPFDLQAARAIDLVDSFLALAEEARRHEIGDRPSNDQEDGSDADPSAFAAGDVDPGFAECVFDRLSSLKLRVSALQRRLSMEDQASPALLRVHLAEIERDGEALESLLREELGRPMPETEVLPALVEPLRDVVSAAD